MERPRPGTGGVTPMQAKNTKADQRTRYPGIVKRGNRYHVRWRSPDGKHHRRSLPTQEAARQLQSKMQTGAQPLTSVPRFDEYAERWRLTFRGRGGPVREHTLRSYHDTLDRELVPFFSRTPLDRVTKQMVREWVQTLERRGLARGTVGLHLKVCKLVFATAVDDELIRSSPAGGMRAAWAAPDAPQRSEPRVLSDEEQDRLIAALPERWQLLGQVLIGCGLRISECLALEWRQVDTGQRRLEVDQRFYRGSVAKPKTRAGMRTVPLSTDLARRLFEARAHAHCDLVFPNGRDGTHLAYNRVWRIFDRARKRVGLGDVGLHDLRHGYGSRLIANGVDVVTVAKLMGHSSPVVTLGIYAHTIPGAALPDVDQLLRSAR